MRPLLAKLLLALLSCSATFAALECVARLTIAPSWLANTTPFSGDIWEKSDLPGVRYVLRPDQEVIQRYPNDPRGYFDEGATLRYRTNSLGFRGPDTTREKPIETFRIVGVGDSYTFGRGVRQEDTFLAVLERGLNDPPGPARIEVLNLGVGGYDTVAEVQILEHKGVPLDPDLVLIVFFLNDTGGVGTTMALNRMQPGKPLPLWRLHSRALDFAYVRLTRRSAVEELVRSYRESFDERAPGWVASRRAILHAKQLAERNDFRLAVVIFPVLWSLSADYPFSEIHEKVFAVATKLHIPVLDLLPAFSGYSGPELWAHPTDQHPNDEAHGVAGRAIEAFVREVGLVEANR